MKKCITLLLCWMAWSATADVYNDNVIILLDASGSMSERMGAGTKMDAAKEAIREVIKTVPESTQIGLLAFTDYGQHADWFYPLGPRDDGALFAALQQVHPSGGTPLGAYIKKAADRLLVERAKQYGYGSYRLLIVTDGEAGDPRLVEQYTPKVIARGITVDVIGVDMDSDHTLATKVHSYRRADDPEALRRAISEVMAEVSAHGAADAGGEEAFAMIAGLPDQAASAMIEALGRENNQPISDDGTGAGVSASSPGKSGKGHAWVWMLIVAAVIIVLNKLSAGRKRRRR